MFQEFVASIFQASMTDYYWGYAVCLSICHLQACYSFFIFPLVLCLFVNHVSVGTIAMNNAWQWRWLIIVPGDPCVLLHLSLTRGPDSKVLV